MKELSIEEKAKAYDELFVKAKQIYNKENDVLILHTVEELFPELTKPDDKKIRKALIEYFGEQCDMSDYNGVYAYEALAWLKKQSEKIDVIENFDTEFEKQVSCLIASAINKEHKYNQGYVKWAANTLLNYAKHELEKQGEQKPAWSEEDESRITTICTYLQDYARLSGSESRTIRINEYCDWLKSLKDRYTWKPSNEQMLAINTAINVLGKGTLNGKQLIELQEHLKKLMEE